MRHVLHLQDLPVEPPHADAEEVMISEVSLFLCGPMPSEASWYECF